jgi:2-polyprenyl-6-methoxyphenol hydroxylase-like FAD-dependent oxidoreductase
MEARALIVGGGIAGLAVARALSARGAEVTVVERSLAWRPEGTALTLARNGLAALDRIGVGDAVRASGHRVAAGMIATAAGAPLGAVPTGWPELLVIHRAALHRCLLEDLDVDPRLGTTIMDLEDGPDGVTCHLDDGSSGVVDVVIGADGVGSQVRALLLGAGAPRVVYAGYTCWRAIADDSGLPGTAVEQWGRGQRVGVIPMVADQAYLFLTQTVRPGAHGPDTAPALRIRFAAFDGPGGRALDALDDDADVLRNDIVELDGVAFGTGRVALIGDAAHAMTPNLGQGAAQALEDAVVLADRLAELPVTNAVEAYAQARDGRVRALQRRARRLGRIGQLRNPVLVAARDGAVRATPADVLRRQAERMVEPGVAAVAG